MTPILTTVILFLLILITLALLAISGNVSIFLKTPKNRHDFLNMLLLELALMYFGVTHNKSTLFQRRHTFQFIELVQKYAAAFLTKEEISVIYSLQITNPIDDFSTDTGKSKTIAEIIEYLRSLK